MTNVFRGKPCCSCLGKWMPVYERMLIHEGVILRQLDVYQLTGNAKASAGTHAGGAFDTAQTQRKAIEIARQMGADATWPRTVKQGFDVAHAHGVLSGCPHNAAARYQIAAVQAGYNGLGRNGRGAADDGPRPLSGRTWEEGIAWAEKQLKAPVPPRVARSLKELESDITEATAEIKRLKKARTAALRRGESVALYHEAIAALKRSRESLRAARKALSSIKR